MRNIYILLLLSMLTTGWGQDCDVPVCMSIQSVNTGTLDIFMINQAGCSYSENSTPIFDISMDVAGCENVGGTWFNGEVTGFQFNIEGVTISSASGGAAAAAGFAVTTSNSTVIGFSLQGATISAGAGVLTILSFTNNEDEICFGEDLGTIADASGSLIAADWGDCINIGCTDNSACNYDPDATNDDGSCAYVFDDCGVCGGDNTACWFLDISTQIGEVQDNSDVLGMHVAAEDGFNSTGNSDYNCDWCYYDVGEPPSGEGNYISFYFPHEEVEWQNEFGNTQFTRDIRNLRDLSNDIDNPSSVWLAVIETNALMGEINIGFDVGYTNLGGNSLIIGYDGTYTAIDMENNATYQFESTGNDELEFIVCSGDNLDENGLDECGIVCGLGIADGACDCDGNTDAGCGCGEAGPSGCDNACGSTAENDECGVCGGNTTIPDGFCDCDGTSIADGYNCDGVPESFSYTQSTSQAFYYFHSVTINDVLVDSDDWVGAFNGDICVGSRQWDTALCANSVCDVPAMGYEGAGTEGYMMPGDIPSFKIYDASEDTYYDAVASEEFPWAYNGQYVFETGSDVIVNLQDGVEGCTDPIVCNYDANANINDGTCLENCPGWEDDPGAYEHTATISGVIILNEGQQMGECDETDSNGLCLETQDMFAAFDEDGNVRGIGLMLFPSFGDYIGTPVFEVQLRSNAQGDLLHFKYYDASEDVVLDIIETYEFVSNDIIGGVVDPIIFYISECPTIDYCLDLHAGANLISFYGLPEDASVENVMSDCAGADINESVADISVATESESCLYAQEEWLGSLDTLNSLSGYWVIVSDACSLCIEDGIPTDSDIQYNLHSGCNLISFPVEGCVEVSSSLPDDIEGSVSGIIGEGVAANNQPPWQGSLSNLCGGKGYWMITTEDISFSFDVNTMCRIKFDDEVGLTAPDNKEIHQSSKQAFYFIESIENIEIGDWILAYNGDVVIGARQWQGSIIDVPAMGSDGSDYTENYIKAGSVPSFKILRDDELIDLEGDIPAFEDNQLYMVSSLTEVVLPVAFSLDRAYPNPFNPTTTLSFAIPVDSKVTLSIYNLQGREVVSLINGNMDAGYHSLIWNANAYASGVYFVKMVAGDFVNTQKLMLIK